MYNKSNKIRDQTAIKIVLLCESNNNKNQSIFNAFWNFYIKEAQRT